MDKPLGKYTPECQTVIQALRKLPHTYDTNCAKCGAAFTYHAIEISAPCPECGTRHKVRQLGAYTDPQDVVGAALHWLSKGPDFERIIAEREKYYVDHEDLEDED